MFGLNILWIPCYLGTIKPNFIAPIIFDTH
ncbi:conserved hypothetical protein [Candidatus Nitrotoga fabula]|uniref:Uncharacterized protein n=1 Tax=Candidatus Nitrotoga fabula TaxID=2182327 RepID=A0A2X0QSE1_9PROT|nr:conserved hypothetical protein [Candidatus Nitrotoga fabula]SPS04740.1 protein of unknown function [Candidatus Nitrotoga fabula]